MVLSPKALLALSKRFGGAVRKAESDVIVTNMSVILGFELAVALLPVRSLVVSLAGTNICFLFFSTIRMALLVFGLNVIAVLLRIARRLVNQVEAEPVPAPKQAAPPKGPGYLIRDEVVYNKLAERSAPLQKASQSALNLDMRSMSMNASQTLNQGAQARPLEGPPVFRSAATLPASLALPGGLPLPKTCTPFRVLASPAPMRIPGTPVAADDLAKRLPGWTDKLVNSLQQASEGVEVPKAKENATPSAPSAEAASLKPTTIVERKALTPDETLKRLGLGLDIDRLTENLRAWFSRQILQSLVADLDETNEALARSGLDHLSALHPASFSSSLFGSAGPAIPSLLKSTIAINAASAAQPQSLMDLVQQRSKDDPVVQKRLGLEKYLAFANLASRRAFVIGRVRALAKGGLMAAFNPSTGLDSDTEILLSLFSTFMDEKMPSCDYYDAQPFSGKHFVRIGEKPSTRPDVIQLVQTAPQTFELVAGDSIYRSYPGPNNLFHAIVFLIEFTQCHREGFLGIANLASKAIDLTSIFA